MPQQTSTGNTASLEEYSHIVSPDTTGLKTQETQTPSASVDTSTREGETDRARGHSGDPQEDEELDEIPPLEYFPESNGELETRSGSHNGTEPTPPDSRPSDQRAGLPSTMTGHGGESQTPEEKERALRSLIQELWEQAIENEEARSLESETVVQERSTAYTDTE